MVVLVISMNSNRGSQLTVYDFPSASRRDGGRPWLRAGMGKAPAWLLLASEPLYKDFTVAIFFATLLLCFPVAIAAALSCVCRRRSASNISAKLVLALPFFLAASNLTVVLAPSWQTLSVLSTAVAGAPPPSTFCSAVVARIVDLLHRCFSGPILCSIEFGVSYWCFLCTSNH